MEPKPAFCTEEMLLLLDKIKKQGTINMFGAGTHLTKAFQLSGSDASLVLGYWFSTYGDKVR
jgi:hypothetical protein